MTARWMIMFICSLTITEQAYTKQTPPIPTIGRTEPGFGRNTTYGFGVSKCESWVPFNERDNTSLGQMAWVQGFISGSESEMNNAMIVLDISERQKPESDRQSVTLPTFSIVTSDAVAEWMSRYCRDHPSETIHHASFVLFHELTK